MSFVLPPGAPPAAPRRFPLRAIDAGTTFFLLFGGIWGLVGTVITVVFTTVGGPLWDDLILDRRSAVVSATPFSVKPGNGQINGRPVFRVDYAFTDGHGQTQSSTTRTTDSELIVSASAGAPLIIEYDPQRPSRSRVKGQRASVFGLFVLFPLGFAVVGGTLVLLGLRRVLRLRSVYVRGRAAAATVTAVSRGLLRVNGRPVLRVDYTFDAGLGATGITGRTTTRQPPAVGDRMWILHDPDDPRRNVVV